jgi:hypothetical protein
MQVVESSITSLLASNLVGGQSGRECLRVATVKGYLIVES